MGPLRIGFAEHWLIRRRGRSRRIRQWRISFFYFFFFFFFIAAILVIFVVSCVRYLKCLLFEV